MVAIKFEMLPELVGEVEEEAMELEPLFSRREAIAQRFGTTEWSAFEFEAQPIRGTNHMLDCPADCPPAAAAQCIRIVGEAINAAIKLAIDAANKLETALKVAPDARKHNKAAGETARLFNAFFCHDLLWPVPWAKNEASGISIAKRFRAVARELGREGKRRIVFRCLPTAQICTACAFYEKPKCCSDGDVALTCPFHPDRSVRNTVHLCPPFWKPSAGKPGLPPTYERAATILHEMLHLLFADGAFLADEGRRANAYCHEAFALRVNGFGATQATVARCGPLC